jgi:hypothetical protein
MVVVGSWACRLIAPAYQAGLIARLIALGPRVLEIGRRDSITGSPAAIAFNRAQPKR